MEKEKKEQTYFRKMWRKTFNKALKYPVETADDKAITGKILEGIVFSAFLLEDIVNDLGARLRKLEEKM